MTEEIKQQQLKKFEILHKKYKSHLESMAVSAVYCNWMCVPIPNCYAVHSICVCMYIHMCIRKYIMILFCCCCCCLQLECDLLTGSQRKLAEMSKMATVLDARG